MKKIALTKRPTKGTTKRKKPMATRKKAKRKAPAKTRTRRRAVKSKARKSRVTLYKRGNKYYAPRKAGRYAPTLRKGMKINPSRRRRVRRNPSFSLKKVLNTKLLINGSLVAGGFIAGAFIADKIRSMVPQLGMLGQFSGAVNIVAGLLTASMVKNEKAKMVALGMIGSGAYDIISQFMPSSVATPAMGYHGLPTMGFHDKMQSYQDLGASSSLLGASASLLGDEYEHEMDDIEEAF